MRLRWVSLSVLTVMGMTVAVMTGAGAQGLGRDPNIVMADDCSPDDPAWNSVGGCPESDAPRARAYKGDVTVAEFFALLTSPLAPNDVIGHPSWRNEPSYVSIRSGQTLRVTNRGGRVHTFTPVQDFGGGFVPLLNEDMTPAPECGANFAPHPDVQFVGVFETQQLDGLEPGLHKFQCCIHPWMRAAVRVK